MQVLLWYGYWIGALSLVGFLAMGLDKLQARMDFWRTPERTLLMIGLLGGAPGAWAAMALFRHKTQHRMFSWGLPLMTLLQGAIALGILWLMSGGGVE